MNENGHSALIKAAIRGHIWIVDALCQAGANIDHIDNQGMNALHFACLNGRNSVVNTLIEQGINIHANNHFISNKNVLA